MDESLDPTLEPPHRDRPAWTRDGAVLAGVGVWALSILPSLAPVLSPDATYVYADQYSDVAMLLLTMGLTVLAIRRADAARERQFWSLVVATLCCWLLVRVLFAVVPYEEWGWGFDLLSDVLYLGGYLAIVLGLERRPDRVPTPGHRGRLQNLEVTGALVFGFGLLTYFVLIPSVFDPEAYASWVPSLLLYGVLDLFLLARVVAIRASTTSDDWRATYGLLALAIVFWFLGDVTEGFMYMGSVPWVDPGTPVDLLWHMPSLFLLLAVRSRSWRGPPSDPPHSDDLERRLRRVGVEPGSSLTALVLALPLVHLVVARLAPVNEATQRAGDLLTVVLLLVLAGLLVRRERLRHRMVSEVEGDRRMVSEQLQAAQRMEAVGRLAAGVAHDFSNLLSVIRGRADLLLMNPLDEGARGDAEEIVAAARRGESLVTHLLTLSRRSVEDAAPLDLADLVDELRSLLTRVVPESMTLEIVEGRRAPIVHANRSQVEQVALNLVLNARDAMGTSGTIRVSTEVREVDDALLAVYGAAEPGPYVVLTVQDEGPGIPPEIRHTVLEPFFTTKKGTGGAGLGLSIVHGVAQQTGGFVRISDAEGGGAAVEIFMPLARASPAKRVEPARVGRRGRETILVVEDYDPLRRTAVRVLSEAGYRVLDAPDGVDALGILERRTERVDLMLVDLVLPDISGYELRDRARRTHPGMAVLLMSGYAAMIMPEPGSEDVRLLEKPFSPQELTTTVREVLDGHAARPADVISAG